MKEDFIFNSGLYENNILIGFFLQERDSLRQRCSEYEHLLTKRSDSSSTAQKLLLEKDEQISQLLAEGEKLSKQQLQLNNVIKKLRSKEKELTSSLESQREKNEAQSSELERLKSVLDNKCEVEKTQSRKYLCITSY